MSSEPESFLVRWSRRKREAVREASRADGAAAPELPPPAPAPVPPAVEAAATAPETPAATRSVEPDPDAATAIPLPPIESLDGLRSDYEAFFKQPVAEELRRAAVKKLFADPHFNKMDMLDVYVDDYTQFEPLPAEMRVRLASARPFLLDAERAALEAVEAPVGTAGDALAASAGGSESEGAANADDGDEAGRSASPAASADAGSTPTAATDATTPDASSAEEPDGTAHASSASVHPDSSSAAPDPRST